MKFSLYAKVLQKLNPRYSFCHHCGYPWNKCQSKSVYYEFYPNGIGKVGAFATCQKCWDKLSLNKLKKYYTELHKKWDSMIMPEWVEERKEFVALDNFLQAVEIEYLNTHEK